MNDAVADADDKTIGAEMTSTAAKRAFHCQQCAYVTDRKNNLKRHVITMHERCSKSLECCDRLFYSKASLRDHVTASHKHGYDCRVCGRNFCRKALLKRHLTVHSGQKDYTCEVCGYATSHKSNLDRHKRRHLPRELRCRYFGAVPVAAHRPTYFQSLVLPPPSLRHRTAKAGNRRAENQRPLVVANLRRENERSAESAGGGDDDVMRHAAYLSGLSNYRKDAVVTKGPGRRENATGTPGGRERNSDETRQKIWNPAISGGYRYTSAIVTPPSGDKQDKLHASSGNYRVGGATVGGDNKIPLKLDCHDYDDTKRTFANGFRQGALLLSWGACATGRRPVVVTSPITLEGLGARRDGFGSPFLAELQRNLPSHVTARPTLSTYFRNPAPACPDSATWISQLEIVERKQIRVHPVLTGCPCGVPEHFCLPGHGRDVSSLSDDVVPYTQQPVTVSIRMGGATCQHI